MKDELILGNTLVDLTDQTQDIKQQLLSSPVKVSNISAETMHCLLSHGDIHPLLIALDTHAISTGVTTISEKLYNAIHLDKRGHHELTLYGVKFIYW